MFPSYFSDVSDISQETQGYWQKEQTYREKFRKYYNGTIFKEKVPKEVGADESDIELYPVGLNLVKLLCVAQADSLFGEWEERVVTWGVDQDTEIEQPQRDAAILLHDIQTASKANSMFWEMAIDREVYGGAAMKITPSFSPGYVKWSRVQLESFYPIWDPEEEDVLLEVYVVTELTKEQAWLKYKYKTDKDTVYRVEKWNVDEYEVKLDDKVISTYSGRNPWAVVPFVYFPRMRSTSWWGESLTADIMRVQDELNMRVADLGEAVHYNSHPTRWGINLPMSFNSDNYPLGPNMLWDLGRKLGDWPEPKVGMLQATDPVPKGAYDFVEFLYDWGMTQASAPPIAFGKDDGGGQRSGVTLEIRMWPLIKATRRSRAYFSSGLQRASHITARILRQKEFDGMSVRALAAILDNEVVPQYSPIMPRDQAALVDEVVKRRSTVPPVISVETSVKKLGEGATEVDKIDADLVKYPPPEPTQNSTGSHSAQTF
jgi:hypothetical protein